MIDSPNSLEFTDLVHKSANVLVIASKNLGGAEIASLEWCRALDADIVVLGPSSLDCALPTHAQLAEQPMLWNTSLLINMGSLGAALIAFMGKHNVKHVVLCNTLAGPFGFLARWYCRKITFCYHDLYSHQTFKRKILASLGFIFSNRIVVPSKGAYAALPKYAAKRATVSPNRRGVLKKPLREYAHEIEESWSLAKEKIRNRVGLHVVVVGRIEAGKGIGDLIEDTPAGLIARLTLLGLASNQEYLNRLVDAGKRKAIQIDHHLCLPSDVGKHYRDSDICLHYSRYESTTPFAYSDAFLNGRVAFIRRVPVIEEFAASYFIIRSIEDLIARASSNTTGESDVIKKQLELIFPQSDTVN